MAKTKPQTPTADQNAAAAPEAASGDQTPETGNTGAADAGAAVAAAAPAEAAPVEKPAAKPKAKLVESVLIRGPTKGRWRAGRFFGPEPVEVFAADLTEDEKVALASDPELTIIWNS